MLDIKLIRNQTDYVKTRLADRGTSYDADIDAVLQRDDARRALIFDNEQLKARQNEASRQIPAMKKAGQPVDALMAQMAELSAKIKEDDAKLAVLDAEWADTQTALFEITNRYLAQLMGGQLDIDAGWEQYRAEFNAAGGPELEQAVNDAIAYARETYGT